MKNTVVSLAIFSAVAMGGLVAEASAMECINKKSSPPPSSKPWKAARLVANITENAVRRIDEENGDEENGDEKLPIASITKMMTAYLVIQDIHTGKLSPNDRIVVSNKSLLLPDSCFAINPLPKNIQDISVEDALTHLIFLSSNPMAENLAVKIAGNQVEFVKRMNAQAKEWGMENTHFVNVHGLPVGDRKSEYTTANDLLKMAQNLLPYIQYYKEYEERPLAVDGIALNKEIKPWKQKLIDLGVLFKTATISGCSSLMTIKQLENGALVTIQLCGGQKEKLVSQVARWMEKANDYLIEGAIAQEGPSQYPPQDLTSAP